MRARRVAALMTTKFCSDKCVALSGSPFVCDKCCAQPSALALRSSTNDVATRAKRKRKRKSWGNGKAPSDPGGAFAANAPVRLPDELHAVTRRRFATHPASSSDPLAGLTATSSAAATAAYNALPTEVRAARALALRALNGDVSEGALHTTATQRKEDMSAAARAPNAGRAASDFASALAFVKRGLAQELDDFQRIPSRSTLFKQADRAGNSLKLADYLYVLDNVGHLTDFIEQRLPTALVFVRAFLNTSRGTAQHMDERAQVLQSLLLLVCMSRTIVHTRALTAPRRRCSVHNPNTSTCCR